MSAVAEETTQPCPECGAQIRFDRRFAAWCAACDWNVDPEPGRPEPTRFERAELALARRHGEALLAEMLSGREPRPQRDSSAVLAIALALGVHGVTVVLAVAGVWCLVAGWGGLGVVVGLLLLAMAVVLGPRFRKLPDDRPVLFRADAPELFALVDEIAGVVGTRGVHAIVVDERINAGVTTYGVRRRRLLMLGMPLWEVLTPEERLAVLGHELGHYANGDTRHGFVVATAVRTLSLWHHALQPLQDPSPTEMIVNVLYIVPRLLVRSVHELLVRLTTRAGLRAEYLADRHAARVASTQAAASFMDRLLIADSLAVLLRSEANKAALTGSRSTREAAAHADELWGALTAYTASVPEYAYERQRRAGARRGHRVDTTHPPTHLRRTCLLDGPHLEAAVTPAPDRDLRIGKELAPARTEVARRILRDGFGG
ncbi:M48 family metallopeptidase [Streptomyces sp. YIM S03343]